MPLYFVYEIVDNCIDTDTPIAVFRRFRDGIAFADSNDNYFLELFSEQRGFMNDDARLFKFRNVLVRDMQVKGALAKR